MKCKKPFMRLNLILVGIFLFCISSVTNAVWNLPYKQPDTYKYSSYYGSDLQAFFAANPNAAYKKMQSAWLWYKYKFIMSNGLVRHLRGATTGANESVSEGIGYGLLLSVLNNDQTTFDKIFKAGNTYMWNGNSYYYWNLTIDTISNTKTVKGSGAATDADLDIGLALVFADKLVKQKLWKEGTVSPSYATRAMDVIKSIKTTMCSSDNYLLPGDSWGGDAKNNLNPCYFSTAWLKVFNSYQKTYDFTAVIDNCYKVLAATRNYSKGQAPDWCKWDGSAGGKSYDMSNDAIRTPWRIAMDALWFNDPRAITYCKNSKGTLSSYSSNAASAITDQMAQYSQNGTTTLANTAGGFKECAMWGCAVLGSKDVTYSSKLLIKSLWNVYHGNSDGATLTGNGRGLGSISLSDHLYYYNESIGMLGYAALTGQFPNMWADEMLPPEPDYVNVTTALKASAESVALPDTITFTAAIDIDTSWTLNVTGKTSGKVSTFSGSGKTISVNWVGRGFFATEDVEAVLSVNGINPSASATSLKATVKITSVPNKPVIAAGSDIVVHDFENYSVTNYFKSPWKILTDMISGTSFFPTSATTSLISKTTGNPKNCLKFSVSKVNSYAGVLTYLTGADTSLDIDLSNFESITFDYKTAATITSFKFALGTSNYSVTKYMEKSITPSTEWKTETIAFSSLSAPSGSSSTLDLKKVRSLVWKVQAGTGEINLDNIKLKLKSGQTPNDDVLSLYTEPSSAVINFKTASSHQPFQIFQTSKGLVINAGNNLMPQLEVFTLTGKLVFTHNFNIKVNSGNQLVSIPAGMLAQGQYVAVLSNQSDRSNMMVRSFIWQQ